MDVNAPAALGVGQDPALDTTKLPADHPPKFLAEAKRLYKNSKPPFVTTPGNSSKGSRRAVFVAKDGQRPPLAIRTDLVAKHWGALALDGIYWTLDLNGERFIVQSFPNKGCISGAKWVYCSWTGVEDEFEDLPLAFSCINGEYTSVLGPRTESPAAAKLPMTKYDTLTSATANSLGHDLPVEYLEEAKALYADSRPPFVIHKTKKPRRHVLLATQDGHFSAISTEAEVVYRTWNSVDDYPTLDLDGKRFILMGKHMGHPRRYQYRLWLGSGEGRVKRVVAYSSQPASARKTASGLTEHLPEVDEDPSLSSSSDDEEDQDPHASATEDQQYFYDRFKKAFDPTAIPPPTPIKFSTRQPVASSEPPALKERPRRTPKPTKRARSPSPPAHFGSRSGKTPASVPKRTPRRTRSPSDDSSDLSSPPYETPAPTPGINHRPAPTPETQNPHAQAPTSLPTLTLHKQTHTTLRVTRDSNIIGFVPLRLLACMTMAKLFSGVIAASGHKEYEQPVRCLMAIFDWKDETDVYKTIYIDRGSEGSFEIFLEIIDEAPCWKDEGGKCGIVVEVVRA